MNAEAAAAFEGERVVLVHQAPPPPEPLIQFAKKVGIVAGALIAAGTCLHWAWGQLNAPQLRRIEAMERLTQQHAALDTLVLTEVRQLRHDVVQLALSTPRPTQEAPQR